MFKDLNIKLKPDEKLNKVDIKIINKNINNDAYNIAK